MSASRLLLALCAVELLAGAAAQAATVDYEVAYRYPHVWRGITLREFPVFTASTEVSHENGLGVGFWIGVDLEDDNGRLGEIQEIDIDLFYDRRFAALELRVGYVELIFPGGIDSTGEAYLKLRSQRVWSPALELYYNVDLLRDLFARVSLERSWTPSRRWAATVGGSLAWAGVEYSKFFGGTDSGLHHWGAHFDLEATRRSSGVRLRLAYSDTLNEAVLPEQPQRLWGGLYYRLTR